MRFVSNLILTRLLVPQAFGLMLLVNTTFMALKMFSDLGIAPNILQSRRGEDPAFLNTAFSIQLVRGVVLFLIGCGLAYPLSLFYNEPAFAQVLPVSALAAVALGAISTNLHSMSRALRLGRVVLMELTCQLVSLLTTVSWALVSPTVWALVAGLLAGAVSQAALSHVLLPGIRNRPMWDRAAAHELMNFGKWIFASSALIMLARELDAFIFAKMVSLVILGVYQIARTIVRVPVQVLSVLQVRVLMPVFSRVFAECDRQQVRQLFSNSRWPHLVVGGVSISVLIGAGPAIVAFLYPKQYGAAGWMLQLLAAGTWFGTVLESSNGAALLGAGRPKWTAAGSAARIVGIGTCVPLGFWLFGFPGAIAGLAGGDLLRYLLSSYAIRRIGLTSWRQDVQSTLVVAGTSLLGWLAMQAALPFAGELGAAVAASAVVLLAWLPWAGPLVARQLRGRNA